MHLSTTNQTNCNDRNKCQVKSQIAQVNIHKPYITEYDK